jgi:hypothetical protein
MSTEVNYGSGWAMGVGSVFLVRGFAVALDPVSGLVRLRSPLWKYPWEGGTNVAYCHRRVTTDKLSWQDGNTAAQQHFEAGAWDEWMDKTRGRCEDPNHLCGFFGNYTTGADIPIYGRVMGVIEGWGKVTMGTKGCRVEKAKIVGIGLGFSEKVPNPQWRKWALWRPREIANYVREDFLSTYPDIALLESGTLHTAFPLTKPPT